MTYIAIHCTASEKIEACSKWLGTIPQQCHRYPPRSTIYPLTKLQFTPWLYYELPPKHENREKPPPPAVANYPVGGRCVTLGGKLSQIGLGGANLRSTSGFGASCIFAHGNVGLGSSGVKIATEKLWRRTCSAGPRPVIRVHAPA